jgi:hypothetical protein
LRTFASSVGELASRVHSGDVHNVLAVAGLVPGVGEVADGADAALYLLQGDTKNALVAFAAMVPVIGAGATLGKASVRLGRDAAENLAGELSSERSITSVRLRSYQQSGGVLSEPLRTPPIALELGAHG